MLEAEHGRICMIGREAREVGEKEGRKEGRRGWMLSIRQSFPYGFRAGTLVSDQRSLLLKVEGVLSCFEVQVGRREGFLLAWKVFG